MSENGMIRPCSSPVGEPNWQRGTEDKGATHVPETRQQSRRIGIDIGKNSFRIVGPAWSLGAAPKVVAWAKWKRGLPTFRRV